MKGRILFLVVLAMLAATLAYVDLPPRKKVYNALNLPVTDYDVLDLPTTNLIIAIFNGVIFGIAAWIIFIIADRSGVIK